jgi:hypothetical protein
VHKQTRDDGLVLGWNDGFWQPDFGALRRDGVQLVGLKGSLERAAAFYPANTLMSQDKWPAEPAARGAAYGALQLVNIVNVDIADGQDRGFARCYADERAGKYYDKARAVMASITVDGIPAEGGPAHWSGIPGNIHYIFESDEYVLEQVIFYLESTRGDP